MNLFISRIITSVFSLGKDVCILLCIFVSLILSCALSVPEDGYDYLAPPVITGCWQDGEYIIVQFRGYNDEYYFDGYNVYVSSEKMLKSNISTYKPVELEGYASTIPSYPLSPDDYDPDKLREITLYHYYEYIPDNSEYVKYPFEAGVEYYIRLCSHHSINGVDEDGVSNQDSLDFE